MIIVHLHLVVDVVIDVVVVAVDVVAVVGGSGAGGKSSRHNITPSFGFCVAQQ